MGPVHGDVKGIHARVIACSISEDGKKVTTIEGQYQRFIHSEVMTHRRFSRNSASSRAIPLRKMIARVRANPAIPISFPAEQKGMQGGAELTGWRRKAAVRAWVLASRIACLLAALLGSLGVHKSIANRILEPFAWHKVIITATEWHEFLEQRVHPAAQPEIRRFAECVQAALFEAEPVVLADGQWHTPYVDASEAASLRSLVLVDPRKVSSARCARVSYLNHDGVRDPLNDIRLYQRLASAEPGHWSPMEHVCRPARPNEPHLGNLHGWRQLRHEAEADARERKRGDAAS